MRSNADLEFLITDADMNSLRDLHERDYGQSSAFPVYRGRCRRGSSNHLSRAAGAQRLPE